MEPRDRSDDIFENGPDAGRVCYFAVQYLIFWDECLWRKLSDAEVVSLTSPLSGSVMTHERYRQVGEVRIENYKRFPELQRQQDEYLRYPFDKIREGLRRGALDLVKVVEA